ncbi:MAG: conserved rane protein of unknown function [Frankiales bacterium]|nr:conserved rane protein of unknown function [Frankiales bacterium]
MTPHALDVLELDVLAHGVGSRADLPVPLALALYGAGFAVVISFLALVLLWREPKLQGDAAGRPLPRAVQAVVDHAVTRGLLRAVVLLLTLLVVAVALVGPVGPNDNLAPYALFVTLWVGLIPASLLLGPVWKVVNPLRTLHAGLARITGPAPAADRLPSLGYWPGALSLLVFVWLELVLPERSEPRTVGVFLVLYGVVQLVAGLWFGSGWYARGDGFEVYSSLLGRLSPLGRRDDGRLVLRSPLDGVDGLRVEPGLVAVVLVLVGSTGFDGLSRTQVWIEGPGREAYLTAVPGTFGLLGMIALAAVLYVGATALGGVITGHRPSVQPGLFAHSIVPIAAGYAIAHYFSLLLLDGQATWILASNPFGQDGVDLFGTYGRAIDYTVVGPTLIADVQVGAIVLGHVLGVVLAHDRAVRTAPRRPTGGQVPLVAVMVAFTVGGLALLLSS